MALPARKFDDDQEQSFGKPKFGPDKPSFGVIEGGGQGDGKPAGNLSLAPKKQTDYDSDKAGGLGPKTFKVALGGAAAHNIKPKLKTPEQLLGAEKNSDGATDNGSEQAEKDNLFSGDELPGKFSNFRKKLSIKSRRKVAAIASVIAILFGGFGIAGYLSGPAKAVQLAELLKRPQTTQEDVEQGRIQGFYRYLRTGDIGETRLNLLESKIHSKIQTRLQSEGITIATRDTTGSPTKLTINPRENSALAGLSAEEAKRQVAAEFGVDENRIRVTGNGVMSIDIGDEPIKIKRGFIDTSMRISGMGGITVSMSTKIAAKYYNTPSLFHPIRKAEAAALDKIARTTEQRKAKRAEANKEITKLSPEDESFMKKIRAKLGEGGALSKATNAAGGALSFTDGYCVAKEAVDGIPRINYANTIVPARKGAFSIMALGSQIKSGNDITMKQVGDFVRAFEDKDGKDVFQSRAVNALGGRNSGVDLDGDVKQSFSPKRTSSALSAAIGQVPGGDFACSTAGGLLQAVAGGALLVTTGGTANLVVKSITGIASGIIVQQVIGYIQKVVADEPLHEKVLAGGPEGGGLLAMGAQSAAGMTAINAGGTPFNDDDSQQIREQRNMAYKNEFKSKNFLTKVFDTQDPRSVAGNIIQKTPSDPVQTVANVFNLNNAFSNLGNVFTPALLAAEPDKPYDWPMPEYGFSSKVLNDPKYANPFTNGDEVAKFIEGSEYIDRAKKCFGVNIVKDGDVWAANPEKDVNPAEEDYINANCADDSDERWIRVRVFILDTKVMMAYACFEGPEDDEDLQKACQDIGAVSTIPATPEQPPATSVNLKTELTKIVDQQQGSVAISVTELEGEKRSANVDGDKKFKSASIYKLLSSYSIIKKVERDGNNWQQTIDAKPEQDAGGGDNTLANCFKQMIVWSSDSCGEFLSRSYVTEATVDKDLKEIGLKNTSFSTGTNETSANDIVTFLTKLENKELKISDQNRQRLLDSMKEQKFRDGIPAGTAEETANKVGWLLESDDGPTLNDAGIVYSSKGKYAIAIMTFNNAPEKGNDARSFVNKPSVWINIKNMSSSIKEVLSKPVDGTTATGGTLSKGYSKDEAREIAKNILASGKVTIAPKYKYQIENIANGNFNCNINPMILDLIDRASKSYTIYITSLNRRCTNTLTASGTASLHYTQDGGHAIDIGVINGVTSTGSTAEDLKLLNEFIPALPKGSEIGQVGCGGRTLNTPSGIEQVPDSCNHVHIGVPPIKL